MIIEKVKSPAEMLIVKNVFTDREQSLIWDEIRLLYNRNFLYSAELTLPARYEDGTPKKKNSSVFIDGLYMPKARALSPILEFSEKLLSTKIKDAMEEINPSHGIFKNANQHVTLLNYYENNDHYDFHADGSAYSVLTYLFQEPKRFSGGEIVFKINEELVNFEIENNMSIVFPSCYQHKVLPTIMNKLDEGKMLGRFSIAQFIAISIQ